MPNTPELQTTLTPGDPKTLDKVLLGIGRFLQRPPGVARVKYASAPSASVQVTNRVGKDNTGVWAVLLMVVDAAGAPAAFVPSATDGVVLTALAGGEAYIGLTDRAGLLAFTLGAPLSSGDRLYALVLGEPDFAEAP